MWIFNILYFILILHLILMLHDILLKTWESGGVGKPWVAHALQLRARSPRRRSKGLGLHILYF